MKRLISRLVILAEMAMLEKMRREIEEKRREENLSTDIISKSTSLRDRFGIVQ
jgi:hypothetical protein